MFISTMWWDVKFKTFNKCSFSWCFGGHLSSFIFLFWGTFGAVTVVQFLVRTVTDHSPQATCSAVQAMRLGKEGHTESAYDPGRAMHCYSTSDL
eukprot:3431847-Amphidinium_carterae.1